jgi:HlyD family secretion protein
MKKIIWGVIAMLAVFVIYQWAFTSRRDYICRLTVERLTVSSVNYGLFTEFIPQTGVVSQDTVANTTIVKVPIDELYFSRIVPGLMATTTVNNKDYTLEITNVYTTVTNGRFDVDMVFKSETPPDLADGKTLRLRIALGGTAEALLVPVGGFYKDTRGEWMYVVEGEDRAVKRRVKLGRKNTENFEVLDGLKAGDQVITSSYENFDDQESVDLNEIRKKSRSPIKM